MTRTQYWILLAGSGLVVLLLLLQVIFARQSVYAQARIAAAQQVVADGNTRHGQLQQLATRIYQLSQQTQDQGLKDLLTRQQIATPSTPAPAASSSASPAR